MNYRKILSIFLVLFYLELVYHFFVFSDFAIKNILYMIIFTFFSSIFIDIITNLFKPKVNKWFLIVVLSLISILFVAQFINYKFYGNVISIYSIFNGGQVFGFFNQILTVIKNNPVPMLLFILPPIFLMVFHQKILIFSSLYRVLSHKLAFLVFAYIISILAVSIDKKDLYSAYNIYYYKHVPNQTAQSFGLMTTMRLDVARLIGQFEETIVIGEPGHKSEPEVIYNALELDFASLSANEKNKTIKNIHTYMNNKVPSEQNEYTGYFAGKNLIAIVAEAFSPIAVHPVVTPTLYKLVNTGFKFNNFYTPVYYVSTSDGEYVSLTSLLPKESTWSMSKSSKNYLPYAYGNVFKNLGYTTNAYHNGFTKYYDRHKSHPNMGYKYMACGSGLQKHMKCNIWPQSDVEMINATFDMYSNKTPFMTYYMTISGHLEYNFFGNNMAYKNRKLVEDLPYSNAVKAYMATQIELDRALESLLKKLEAQGILDDTVIVLSADHYPYGLKQSEMAEVMNIEEAKFDNHQNHLIIWNNTMESSIEVDKYASSLDIVPTVLNLFGIKYDSRLLMGTDILSKQESIVIYNDRSWLTSYGKYNATTEKFTPFGSKPLPDNYIENTNTEVYNRFVISKNILDTNYYKMLFPGGAYDN